MDLKSQMKLKFSRVKFCVHVDLYVVDQGSNGFKVTNGVNVFVCKVWAHVALLPPPPSVCHRPAITQEGERVLDL